MERSNNNSSSSGHETSRTSNNQTSLERVSNTGRTGRTGNVGRTLAIAAAAGLGVIAAPSLTHAQEARPSAVSPDFNASGTITPEDLFVYLEHWFANKESADVDGDAMITVWDLFQYLQIWFAARDAGINPKDSRPSEKVTQSDDTR